MNIDSMKRTQAEDNQEIIFSEDKIPRIDKHGILCKVKNDVEGSERSGLSVGKAGGRAKAKDRVDKGIVIVQGLNRKL
jgi:hypothetical protein